MPNAITEPVLSRVKINVYLSVSISCIQNGIVGADLIRDRHCTAP